MNLIKILTAESQKNLLIFHLIEKFYILLKKDNWIKDYIFWELELFKIIGYDLEFKDLVDKQVTNNQLQYFASSSVEKKLVPNFLVEKNRNKEDLSTLLNGLKLVGDYLDKTILKPNNLTQPISRIQFISTLKQLS
jgi:DNA repair protein RecO (recombination protein O)